MPTKEYYLQYRNLFLSLGYHNEVIQLDVHYELTMVYDQKGVLIKII